MKTLLTARVPVALLALTVIVAAAGWILWKVAILDAPPRAAVRIDQPAATTVSSRSATPSAVAVAHPPIATPTSGAGPVASPTVLATALQVITETASPTAIPKAIVVYVSGAVKSPGLYTVTVGSRVGDAIAMAGGLTADADSNAINLASRLSDEDHVVAPRQGDTPVVASPRPAARPTTAPRATARPSTTSAPTPSNAQVPQGGGKVNLNTASEAELENLPGIGPVLAARIVAFRQANGPFSVAEDLMKVPGIKDALFAKLRDFVTVGP